MIDASLGESTHAFPSMFREAAVCRRHAPIADVRAAIGGPFAALHAGHDLLTDRDGRWGRCTGGIGGMADRPMQLGVAFNDVRALPVSHRRLSPMIGTLFRKVAADAGWNDATQVGVLLRYAAHTGSTATLRAFLDVERLAANDADDPFMDAAIDILRDPGLALDVAFRSYCAGCRDLLTPRQAAERWCCWRAA